MKLTQLILFLCIPSALLTAQERVIFHHIPKSGGLTTSKILNQHFTPQETLTEPHQYLIQGKSLLEISQYKFIRGHFLFPRFKGLPGKRITFLRDPIERVLSAHRYYKEIYREDAKKMSIEHICPAQDPLKGSKNQQCKFLSSLDIYNPFISDREHLESAKYNLTHKFFFVGITEDLDNGISILCSLLGFPAPATVPRINKTKNQNRTYPKKLIRKIEKNNSEDLVLYRFAKELYRKKYAHTTSSQQR